MIDKKIRNLKKYKLIFNKEKLLKFFFNKITDLILISYVLSRYERLLDFFFLKKYELIFYQLD